MEKKIAIYGKGGVGKTTIAANLAAAFSESGRRVLLVGCTTTADSSRLLLGERDTVTAGTFLKSGSESVSEDTIAIGYQGVGCLEIGESADNCGCSSRSISQAMDKLSESGVIARFAPDVVIYDLPGDLGCLGELTLDQKPMDVSIIVTSANFQAMYAANRLTSLLTKSRESGWLTLVANGSASSFEDSFVEDFSRRAGLPLAAKIPKSFAVRHSELYGKTVIEAGPLSSHAYAYRSLARQIIDNESAGSSNKAKPLDAARLKEWAHEWGRRLSELEFGIISDGAGI